MSDDNIEDMLLESDTWEAASSDEDIDEAILDDMKNEMRKRCIEGLQDISIDDYVPENSSSMRL